MMGKDDLRGFGRSVLEPLRWWSDNKNKEKGWNMRIFQRGLQAGVFMVPYIIRTWANRVVLTGNLIIWGLQAGVFMVPRSYGWGRKTGRKYTHLYSCGKTSSWYKLDNKMMMVECSCCCLLEDG
jgi:hypothetical protein